MSFYTNKDSERQISLTPALIHALLDAYCLGEFGDSRYRSCLGDLQSMGLIEIGGNNRPTPMGMAVIGRLTQPIVVTQVFRIEDSPEPTSWHPLTDAES